jgi:hypothetical protein
LPRCTFSIYCTLLGAPQQNGSLLPKEVLRRYLVPGYQYCTSCIPVPVNGYGTSYRYSVRYKFIHSTVPGTRLPGIVQYQVQYSTVPVQVCLQFTPAHIAYSMCTKVRTRYSYSFVCVHSNAHCIQYLYSYYFVCSSLPRTLHTVCIPYVLVFFCLQFTPPTHHAHCIERGNERENISPIIHSPLQSVLSRRTQNCDYYVDY